MRIVLASLLVTLLIAAAVLTGVHVLAAHPHHHPTHKPTYAANGCAKPHAGPPYIGVAAVSLRGLTTFGHATGTRPNLLVIYRSFGTPLSAAEVPPVIACGVQPLIQLNPYGISLAAIAAGHYDSYLKTYGAALGRLGTKVAMSFAPEANGDWYSWGCRHTSPAVYVAAWRHLHDVMNQASGRNIIWVWDVNHMYPGACPLRARWPGAQYVDLTAVDGYWRGPGDTFATLLAPTIVAALELGEPVIIGETGAPNQAQAPEWIHSVFQGVKHTAGVLGIVWFNYGDAHGDYRLQDDPSALAMFRQEVKNYN